jgi:hypothetical protein
MGANAVFVTSATPTGSNLYISFKLIDVQTARIEMQKTGKTTRGENDIDVVVRQVVSEMLGSSAASAAKAAQPVRTPSATSPSAPTGELLADGMKVFSKGRQLSRSEVRSLMVNTDALRLYNKGVSRRKVGNVLLWSGIGVTALSFSLSVMSEEEVGAAPAIFVVGCASIGAGITFRILGKNPVKKAVESYNSQLYSSSGSCTPELRFGFTGHGVGLVYRF